MGLFDFGDNNDANDKLDEAKRTEKQYMDPFVNQGKQAYDIFNPITSRMLQDPAAFLESLMQSYAPSRGFQMKRDEMLKSAGNSAAAGGRRGTIGDLGNEAKITDTLMGDDMQQWLKNVMGIQGRGLTSQEHLYDTGFDASKSLADNLANILGSQATLSNNKGSGFGSGLGTLLGGAAGLYFGGPGGAQVGAAAGHSLGSSFL